jgi:hypothetical protein
MPSRCIALVTIAFALVFSANVSTAMAQQKVQTPDQTQIVNTVNTIFTAARADDVAKFDSRRRIGFLYLRWRRPIQRGCRHGRDQSSACSRQTLRLEHD